MNFRTPRHGQASGGTFTANSREQADIFSLTWYCPLYSVCLAARNRCPSGARAQAGGPRGSGTEGLRAGDWRTACPGRHGYDDFHAEIRTPGRRSCGPRG